MKTCRRAPLGGAVPRGWKMSQRQTRLENIPSYVGGSRNAAGGYLSVEWRALQTLCFSNSFLVATFPADKRFDVAALSLISSDTGWIPGVSSPLV